MIQTVFHSGGLPPAEGLAALDSAWRTSSHPMRLVSRTPHGFRATVGELDLGPRKTWCT